MLPLTLPMTEADWGIWFCCPFRTDAFWGVWKCSSTIFMHSTPSHSCSSMLLVHLSLSGIWSLSRPLTVSPGYSSPPTNWYIFQAEATSSSTQTSWAGVLVILGGKLPLGRDCGIDRCSFPHQKPIPGELIVEDCPQQPSKQRRDYVLPCWGGTWAEYSTQ